MGQCQSSVTGVDNRLLVAALSVQATALLVVVSSEVCHRNKIKHWVNVQCNSVTVAFSCHPKATDNIWQCQYI